MATNLELIQEAVKRGIQLPPDKQAMYDEAVKRGLIQDMRVSVADDIKNTTAPSLLRGTVGLGMTGNGIAGFVRGKVGQMMGFSPEQMQALNEAQSQLGIGTPTSTGAAVKKIEDDVTGPLYQAKTVPGQYYQTGVEAAPAMLLGGGSVPSRVGSWLLGSAGSEAAGQATKGSWMEPYARFVGGLLGGVTGGMSGERLAQTGENQLAKVSGREPRQIVPKGPNPVKELDELQTAKTNAYKAVSKSGLYYSPSDYSDMLMNIYGQWSKMNFNPALHDKVNAFIKTLNGYQGKSLSLTELDQLRQQAFRDTINGADEANAAFGKVITNSIDDMIDNVAPSGAADASAASSLMETAREANKAYKTSESIMLKLDKASRQKNKTGKGTNQDNALRQKVDELINEGNGEAIKRYPKDVQAKMREVVDGTFARNSARWGGQFAPTGTVSTVMGGGAGATVGSVVGGLLGGVPGAALGGNLGMFALPAIGQVSKMAADRGTRKAVEDLLRIVQAGGSAEAAGVNAPSLLGQNLTAGALGGASAINSNRFRGPRPVLKR